MTRDHVSEASSLATMLEIPPQLAEAGGRPATAAMLSLKRAIDAGGGWLREKYVAEAQEHIADINPQRHGTLLQHLQATVIALGGRGSDSRIAHVTPGEIVIPERLQTPEVLEALKIVARAHGIDLARLQVGNAFNRINPQSGQAEFQDADADVPNPSQPDNDTIYHDADGNVIEGIDVVGVREPTLLSDAKKYLGRLALGKSNADDIKKRAQQPVGNIGFR